jgi:hypothetical protein
MLVWATLAGVANAQLTPSGTTITPIEGNSFTVVVGSFTDANIAALPSDFTATIDWGDGSGVSAASAIISTGGGGFDVSGSHTYADEGSFSITVTVTDVGGSSTTINSTANVADAALTPSGTTITPIEGTPFTFVVVGSFTDANAAAPLSDFTATIDWGDGSGVFAASAIISTGGGFDVSASHTYADEGSFSITVTVTDVGGSSTTINSTANVADAALSGSARVITTTVGHSFTDAVAGFTDGNPLAPLSDFTATVDWGDGSPIVNCPGASCSIAGPVGGPFTVTGTHTYHSAGSFTITVVINDQGGSTVTVDSAARVLALPVPVISAPMLLVLVALLGLIGLYTLPSRSRQ